MDIFLFRAIANNIRFKNASSSKSVTDAKGAIKSSALATVGAAGGSARGTFLSPDVSFEDVNNAYKTDSYVRQAIDKYSELLFKSGWQLHGNNDAAILYLKSRFAYMSFATGNPFDQMLIEIAEDLVKYGNAVLVKVRNKKNITMGSVKATGIGKNAAPIGGYFRINPRTIQVSIDGFGNVTAWQQVVSGGTPSTFKTEDIIHIYYKREAGEVFATPYVAPALEDVRLLRTLEDNTATLVYRYAVPIYQWMIGLAQPGYEASTDEIIEAKNKINEMPSDGAIITNERTTIKSIGAQGQALQAAPYLTYFQERVFTGLGVSDTQMGRGGGATKGTSDSLDQGTVDRVKAFQKVMALGVTNGMLVELLLEGGFDPLNNPDDMVDFTFNEINIDTQIKVENHKVFLFQNNAVTFEELRADLGRNITVDEARLAYSILAVNTATPETSNLNQPENQKGKKLAPVVKPLVASRKLNESVNGIHIKESNEKSIYYTYMNDIGLADNKNASIIASSASRLISNQILSDLDPIESAKKDVKIEKSLKTEINLDKEKVLSIVESELRDNIYKLLVETAAKSVDKDKLAVFQTNEYRLKFIKEYWQSKMYNITKLLCYKQIGVTHIYISGAESTDKICSPKNVELALSNYTTKNIPPFHPGCKCIIKPKEQ